MKHKPKRVRHQLTAEQLIGGLIVLVFAALSIYFLAVSNAATPYASSEAESGSLGSGALAVTDNAASAGSAVKFGGGSGGISSGSSFISGAWDLGWANVGSAAPFSDLAQDDLFAVQTENGTALDTSFLATIPSVTGWVNTVHAHPNTKAMITVGGIDDQHWQDACTGSNLNGFVTNLVNFMKNNGFDGIDIDIEDNVWAAMNPPVAAWDTCVETIANAAHATTTAAGKRPLISEDVTTNWMGSDLVNEVQWVDQFNLMTYGDTCTSATNCPTFASDVSDTANQMCPNGGSCLATIKSKFTVGLDMDDSPGTKTSCGYAAAWAKAQGLLGAFDWDLTSDQALGGFPCQTAIFTNG